MTPEYLNEMAKVIHQQNCAVGWWDDPDRCLYECLQLVNTEVAEATEAARKDLMDDHLPSRKGEEVELADALIRVLDFGGRLGLVYAPSDIFSKMPQSWTPGPTMSVGQQHLIISMMVTFMTMTISEAGDDLAGPDVSEPYSGLIDGILKVATVRGHDTESAMVEKLDYNARRQDHKREARAAANGKKF